MISPELSPASSPNRLDEGKPDSSPADGSDQRMDSDSDLSQNAGSDMDEIDNAILRSFCIESHRETALRVFISAVLRLNIELPSLFLAMSLFDESLKEYDDDWVESNSVMLASACIQVASESEDTFGPLSDEFEDVLDIKLPDIDELKEKLREKSRGSLGFPTSVQRIREWSVGRTSDFILFAEFLCLCSLFDDNLSSSAMITFSQSDVAAVASIKLTDTLISGSAISSATFKYLERTSKEEIEQKIDSMRRMAKRIAGDAELFPSLLAIAEFKSNAERISNLCLRM